MELNFGSELQTIQFMGRVTTFRPFGTADIHLSPNTVLEYRYATSEPNSRLEKGFDSGAGGWERIGAAGQHGGVRDDGGARASSGAFAVAPRRRNNSPDCRYTRDRVSDPALTGVGEFTTDNGNVLPDLYSGTFTYQGNDFHTQGASTGVAAPADLENDGHNGLRIRRSAGFGHAEREPGERVAVEFGAKAAKCGGESYRHGAEVEDSLDGVVSLDQRGGSHSGGYVQRVGGASRSLFESVLPASAFPEPDSSPATSKPSSICAICWRRDMSPSSDMTGTPFIWCSRHGR